MPLTLLLSVILLAITASRSHVAQDEDFHMVMQIRAPLQRCLEKEPVTWGDVCKQAQRKTSLVGGQRHCVSDKREVAVEDDNVS